MLTLRSKKKIQKGSKEKKMANNESSSDIRLPLDLLFILDVEVLEESLICQYAIEYENELTFCKTEEDLQEVLEDMDGARYYKIDDIEHDRIHAVIDLLNLSDKDAILGHILDRIVR